MQQRNATGRRNKWLATIMGLAMPGLGQIYNGELIKGTSYFTIILVLHFLGFRWSVLLPDRWVLAGAFCTVTVVIAVYIAAIIDAYKKASSAGDAFQPAAYNRWYFYVAAWLLGWVLAMGAVIEYVRNDILEAYVIPSGSMEPTVKRGDRVLADKTAYHRMAPHKGDIAILVYPDDRSLRFIKRIGALPGETVTMADGLDTQVPHGFVYMVGDNRQNSYDSRQFGFVPLTDLVGKVRQVYFSSGPDGIRWERIGTVVR